MELDTPDPYVILKLDNSPCAWRKTTVKDNDVNPEWNEEFTFWLDPEQNHVLKLSLMDGNYTIDEHLATEQLPLSPLPMGTTLKETITFNKISEIDIEVRAEMNRDADLRYSLALSREEKSFTLERKRHVQKAMKEHFGFGAPKFSNEVPVIGVIGSGGGFRAMVAYSGAMAALSEMGILDMTTFVGGLSGSAWYLAQLYAHPEWPNISPGKQREEIKHYIDHSFLWLLKTHGVKFAKAVWEKRSRGEPVSFTDLFGHLVGTTLLKHNYDVKLSDQREVLKGGRVPLPLYAGLHVKKTVSAKLFHEWMEFSPYEVGLPKYGTFLDSQLLACKFFMGCIVKRFPEPPLHYLLGIWGSAFCVQLKTLMSSEQRQESQEDFVTAISQDLQQSDLVESDCSEDEDDKGNTTLSGSPQTQPQKTTKSIQTSLLDFMKSAVLESSLLQSIHLRAARIFNFMRGLSYSNVYPFSPFKKTREEEVEQNKELFEDIFELHPTNLKKLYLVDSGLTFNSPYPLVLRPQREVDLILSFDFSARPTDDAPGFKDLVLAAKWAKLNKVPFPPIDPNVAEKEGLKECYVFKHPWDPLCPIVVHFRLANINFRRELRPGVPRTTQEELDFANFSLFDDPAKPYSTFNFTYTHQEFDRLSKLMEFNTLLSKDIIFDNIRTCIKRRKRFSIRRPCKKRDVSTLSLSIEAHSQLLAFIAKSESGGVYEEADKKDETDSVPAVVIKDRRISMPIHGDKRKRYGASKQFLEYTAKYKGQVVYEESEDTDTGDDTDSSKKSGGAKDKTKRLDPSTLSAGTNMPGTTDSAEQTQPEKLDDSQVYSSQKHDLAQDDVTFGLNEIKNILSMGASEALSDPLDLSDQEI
ncbi:cytosolic phospholipase A2-like [Physella acuta]|uniref:cytosolic phospholipase A2-like n=1 Tax=Physella acuta TaxID=109671 RepID=UPI0027DD0E71|nr:cytosolic phospholipase A2-like [Physella acuta]